MESNFKLHLQTSIQDDFLVKVPFIKYKNFRKGEGVFFIKSF